MIRVFDFGYTGTHKEIGVEENIREALHAECSAVCVISSGNYVNSLREQVRKMGLEGTLAVLNLVNRRARDNREIQIPPGLILRDAAEREEFVKSKTGLESVIDVTDITALELAERCRSVIQAKPGYLSVPIGSGKLFTAFYIANQQLRAGAKLIGVMPRGENGVFNDDNLYTDTFGNLHYRRFKPISLADKLSTPYIVFKEQILQARGEGHILIEASNLDFWQAARLARKRGYNPEYSGSAGFVAGLRRVQGRYGIPEDADILVINTGRGNALKKHQELSLGARYLKPVLVAAASVIIGIQGSQMIHNYSTERQAAESLAMLAARQCGQEVNAASMSNDELWQYARESEGCIGGPHNYWL